MPPSFPFCPICLSFTKLSHQKKLFISCHLFVDKLTIPWHHGPHCYFQHHMVISIKCSFDSTMKCFRFLRGGRGATHQNSTLFYNAHNMFVEAMPCRSYYVNIMNAYFDIHQKLYYIYCLVLKSYYLRFFY